MELFSTLFGNPFRLIGVVAGLAFIASALCAFGVWAYLHWRIARAANEKLTGIAGALGSNLTLIAALMLFGLGTICAAGALVFPVPGTEIAMIPCPGITVTTLTATQLGATPCPTSSIGTGTPGGRNETATSTPTLARISPASTSTASPTPTFTPTFTATVPLRLTLTPVITRTVTITPSPTGRSMPATFVLETTFKATKCGSPGARPSYNVTIQGDKINMDQIGGRNKYEGTFNSRTLEFKMNGTVNIGAGLSEIFEGKFTLGSKIAVAATYTIKGQSCEEIWQVEGQEK